MPEGQPQGGFLGESGWSGGSGYTGGASGGATTYFDVNPNYTRDPWGNLVVKSDLYLAQEKYYSETKIREPSSPRNLYSGAPVYFNGERQYTNTATYTDVIGYDATGAPIHSGKWEYKDLGTVNTPEGTLPASKAGYYTEKQFRDVRTVVPPADAPADKQYYTFEGTNELLGTQYQSPSGEVSQVYGKGGWVFASEKGAFTKTVYTDKPDVYESGAASQGYAGGIMKKLEPDALMANKVQDELTFKKFRPSYGDLFNADFSGGYTASYGLEFEQTPKTAKGALKMVQYNLGEFARVQTAAMKYESWAMGALTEESKSDYAEFMVKNKEASAAYGATGANYVGAMAYNEGMELRMAEAKKNESMFAPMVRQYGEFYGVEDVKYFQGWESLRAGGIGALGGAPYLPLMATEGALKFLVDVSPVGSVAAASSQIGKGDYLGAASTFAFHPLKVGLESWPVQAGIGLAIGASQVATGNLVGAGIGVRSAAFGLGVVAAGAAGTPYRAGFTVGGIVSSTWMIQKTMEFNPDITQPTTTNRFVQSGKSINKNWGQLTGVSESESPFVRNWGILGKESKMVASSEPFVYNYNYNGKGAYYYTPSEGWVRGLGGEMGTIENSLGIVGREKDLVGSVVRNGNRFEYIPAMKGVSPVAGISETSMGKQSFINKYLGMAQERGTGSDILTGREFVDVRGAAVSVQGNEWSWSMKDFLGARDVSGYTVRTYMPYTTKISGAKGTIFVQGEPLEFGGGGGGSFSSYSSGAGQLAMTESQFFKLVAAPPAVSTAAIAGQLTTTSSVLGASSLVISGVKASGLSGTASETKARTITLVKPITRSLTLNSQGTKSMFGEISTTAVKTGTGMAELMLTKTTPELKWDTKSTTLERVKPATAQSLKLSTVVATKTGELTTTKLKSPDLGIGTGSFTTPPPPPPWKPPTDFGLGGGGQSFRSSFHMKAPKQGYKPSVIAREFGITMSRSKALKVGSLAGGMGIRPLVSGSSGLSFTRGKRKRRR